MTRAALIALAIVAALGASGAAGYRVGRDLLRGELAAAQVKADATAANEARQLAIEEQRRASESQALEDQANAEPVAVPAALPHSRVMRLNARIAAANRSGP